jgi:hypothetical protein
MADRELRKKLKRKAKKKQRRELGDAIEDTGHHKRENNGEGKSKKRKKG